MRIMIDMRCDNAAFDPDPNAEVARILRELADRVEDSRLYDQVLHDVNGNQVGTLKVVEGE